MGVEVNERSLLWGWIRVKREGEMDAVVKGTVALLKSEEGRCTSGFALQVTELTRLDENTYKHVCSDGADSIDGVMVSEAALSLIASGGVRVGSVIRVMQFDQDTDRKLRVRAMVSIGFAPVRASPSRDSLQGVVERSAEVEVKRQAAHTSGGAETAARKIELATGNKIVVPLEALHPYGFSWTVKVKVCRKMDKRSFTRKGEECSVFSAQVVDEKGTQAEVTFWREQADMYYDSLQEGKVYMLSNFNVKPANRNYTVSKFEYCLHMDKRAVVEECADQNASKMKEHLKITSISKLPEYLGRQALVSVMGVVMSAGPQGTVKRKSDSSEIARRDVTIMDKSMKSVVITFWDKMVEDSTKLDMHNDENPVVTISGCRVTDFNGLSLSSTLRTNLDVSPDTEEANEMKSWYESVGIRDDPTPIGDGMPNSRQTKTAHKRKLLASIQPKVMPDLDTKAQYGVIHATIAQINPDQALVYLANHENNKKVVEKDGSFWCEAEGKTYSSAHRRYVMTMKITDCSGECLVTVFHDQAKEILGMDADAMCALRSSNETRYRAVMAQAQWRPFVFRTASKPRFDMQSNSVQMRHSVAALHEFDWTKESRILLDRIGQMRGARGIAPSIGRNKA